MRLRRAIVTFLSLVLPQCSSTDPGNVGAPCTPSLEKDPSFAGFRVTEETIEVGAPECGGGVCLVNHFQGRVSCPLGQPSPEEEDPAAGCQAPSASPRDNAGKICCLPDTLTQVESSICGQCAGNSGGQSTRTAESAVYCTCRCGVAEGEPDEPDYPFCECPDGFECSEIRKDVGVGDPRLAGKYCIRQGTAYDPDRDQCGQVHGHWVAGGADGVRCGGVGTGQCQSPDGPCEP